VGSVLKIGYVKTNN